MSRKLMFSVYHSLAVRQALMTIVPSLTSALSLIRASKMFKKKKKKRIEIGKRN